MFLASKYEEMYPPEISDFAYVTDRAYTTAQIRDMEMTILRVLKFQLGRPLPLQFLRRASKIYEVCSISGVTGSADGLQFKCSCINFSCISSQVTAEQHTLAKYLLELTMVDYEMVHLPPSMVASAALALTLKILDAGEWVSASEGSRRFWCLGEKKVYLVPLLKRQLGLKYSSRSLLRTDL